MLTRFAAYSARAAVPSDSVDEVVINKQIPDGFMVGAAGNVVIVSDLGTVITLTGVVANTVYPFRLSRINSTGTTATGIMALFQRHG